MSPEPEPPASGRLTVAPPPAEPAAPAGPGAGGGAVWDAARVPALVFAAVETGAFVLYLLVARHLWFFADEWEFLSGRGLGYHDLVRTHYGHWVAAPLAVYRLLWATVGLRSYLPYVGVAIALHLAAAALLWLIMRRAGVAGVPAAAVAGAFALFGAGAQDILWAFQIAFTGALVLGLLHVLALDHDGPFDRRDALGLLAGAVGLMCSGVAITMVVVAGIAALLRRGLRIAALHTLPLVALYGAWWLAYSRGSHSFTGSAAQVVRWFVTGAAATFGAIGHVPGAGWLLGLALVAGGALALRAAGARALRTTMAAPCALLLGAAVFLVVAGIDRGGLGSAPARQSRYLHVVAALVLPALGLAIDALARRARVAGVVALVVLVAGVPGNIGKTVDYAHHQRLVDDATRTTILAAARDPLARSVPRALRPDPLRAPTLTVGWLLAGVASGRIPAGGPLTPGASRALRLRLSLMELDRKPPYPCSRIGGLTEVRLVDGEQLGVVGKISVVLVTGPGESSTPVLFGAGLLNPSRVHDLVAVAGPLELHVRPAAGLGAALCRPVA